MKTIAITEPGAPPTLVDLPDPSPAEGEVLVRIQASSINGFDLSVAHGRLAGMMEHRYPVVLGKDFWVCDSFQGLPPPFDSGDGQIHVWVCKRRRFHMGECR